MLEESSAGPLSPPRPGWTFLTNHAHVLLSVAQHPGIRMREVAQTVGVTERCVQRILTELEDAGYVTRVRQGRRNYYRIHAHLPLRHPAEQHHQVSALLDLVLGVGGQGSDAEA
jgi:DNA-binding IclR family transcriptional regulator